jgi:hypothetical protein
LVGLEAEIYAQLQALVFRICRSHSN